MWNVGSLSSKGGEVCNELRRRMIDMRGLQEVRWRGQGSWMLGMGGKGIFVIVLWKMEIELVVYELQ